MTILQTAIANALEKIGARQSPYSDSILLKEIRSANKIENKKKASVRVEDVEKAVENLAETGKGFWSIHLDSVNNLLIKKVEGDGPIYLSQEDKRNRQRSEKSMSLITEADLAGSNKPDKKKSKKPKFERWMEE